MVAVVLDEHRSPVLGRSSSRTPPTASRRAGGEPRRPLVGPRRATPDPARHRAGRAPLASRARAGLGWPLTAVLLVGLVGVRATMAPARPGEGVLTASGVVLLTPDAGLPVPALSPDGVGAVHAAVYGTVTRALERHATLVAVDRELALVTVLLSCVLLWRTARRLGLGDPAAAVAVLLLGLGLLAPAVLLAAPAVDGPALLGLPWLLLAGCLLAPGRPAPATLAAAVLAAAVAVLLAPDVLVLVAALGATAIARRAAPRLGPVPTVGLLLVALVVLVAGTAPVLDRWDPRPTTAALLGTVPAAVLTGGCALLGLVALAGAAGLSGRLRRLEVPAVGVLATAGAAALTGRFPLLLVCLPLTALLVAGLAEQLLAGTGPARPWARRAVAGAAALALGGMVAVVLADLLRTPPADLGARDHAALVGWVDEHLHPDARVVAPPRLWAELVHAGADTDQVRLPGTAGDGEPHAPVLTAAEDGVPAGGTPVARFGPSDGRPGVVLTDGSAGSLTPEELTRRRALADALLASPMAAAGGQAADVLAAARVDPRVLALLAGIGGQLDVTLHALPTAAGEERTGTLVRSAVLRGASGAPLLPGAPDTERVLAWLDAQWPPFAPDTVELADGGVRFGYAYVSAPDALVTEATS